MPVISSETLLQIAQDSQDTLGKFDGLIRVFGSETVEAGYEFIYARIVFHGAGAERIHSQIDGVIPGGKAREVADHLDFADLGEAFDFGAQVLLAQFAGCVDGGHIERR